MWQGNVDETRFVRSFVHGAVEGQVIRDSQCWFPARAFDDKTREGGLLWPNSSGAEGRYWMIAYEFQICLLEL